MAKTKKLEEILSVSGEAAKIVSYADYFSRRPLFSSLQIKNTGEEAVNDLILSVTNENAMLIPCEKSLEEIPYESVVEVDLGNILSPHFFAGLEDVREEKIEVVLKTEKRVVAKLEQTIKVLPFDFWQGMEGDAEQLAAFVRPKLGDCARLHSEVESQLKKWNVSCELGSYIGNDKNAVRRIIAALYAAIRRFAVLQKPCDITKPVEAGAGVKILTERKATNLEMGLFVCACLESLGLHSVLILGEQEIGCGVWLYDSCFIDTVSDDTQRLGAYISDGINNLSCFDVADLFSDKNSAYSTSESHFKQKLEAGNIYDRYVDIQRCRISHILPLPLRARNLKGYEILSEEDMSLDAAPTDLKNTQKLSLDNEQTKDKQWERRLLDLSMKNTLLNFSPTKSVTHLLSVGVDNVMDVLTERGEMNLAAATTDVLEIVKKGEHFGVSSKVKGMRELIELENNSGLFRTYSDDKTLNETITRLIKKNKEADEESGTKILYLAMGFMKWYSREDGAEKYAPLVLQPIQLKKSKGGNGYAMVLSDEEPSVNSTLLEFLKQEFNIDIRGLDGAGAIQGLKISAVLAMIRAEIVRMRNWEVYDDAYIAAFSFARYQMWNDLRQNIGEFSKNKIIEALLNNSVLVGGGVDEIPKEDEAKPETTLTPLPADASQWAAIALSQTGKSFVLHGPPGTGKSQTITNMIANALNDGKRVLFVAEKQAALSVVKKRLDGIGLGEFCLELHSNKTNKSDVLQKLTTTLSLAEAQENVSLSEKSAAITKLREDLSEPLNALHKKRRLGVSIYEAMLVCLKNKNAPDIMNIESTFYDGLTKEKIDAYEQMMTQAAATAKECGGVHNSPFSNVNLTEYDLQTRDSLYCSSEVVIAEIKHLKNYIALFLDLYRQKISTLTRKKLETLYEIAKILDSGSLNRYFKEDEQEFYAFFNANKRLDICMQKYFASYKKLVDISKEYKELGKWLEDGRSDYEKHKVVKGIVKKLSKVALVPPTREEALQHLEMVCEIYEAMERIRTNTKLSQYFTFAFGRVDYFNARKNFLKDLYKLHDMCATVFMDYNPDSFNSMCIRAASGYSAPVLQGLMRSVDSFRVAENSFLNVMKADRKKIAEEEILDSYTAKAGALIENIDMLANWCMYKKTAKALDEAGLTFITDALENGSVTSENIIDSFEKNVYKNFLQTNIPLDPILARFSAAVCEEKSESLRLTMEEFSKLTKEAVRAKLISRLPTAETEGALSLELANFQRYAKANLRGMGLRKLFEEIPELIKTAAPCMLMSPITVSQYLKAENGLFDMVIFDEASQIPTAEAICTLARGKSAIVVGDPKQLPPTTFFNANYVDEDNLENEDMESVLDDCLAINMPQRHLTWHYRSKHESLIAFSNIMYYENRLCTFPSPDALSSKVNFMLVEDGVYDRGFSKKNKVEGDALVAEVLRRLNDPTLKKQSMGIVTFSNVQKDYIERKLSAAIVEKRLESVAYDREEPLFVKNLENVQGDERDIILFSVCYGPDRTGRISLNFGPLNQAGGWRRLNVAVSRAREEMVVFSSMTGGMIDLSKTNSRGVAGLKAFLDFAQKGRTNLAISSNNLVTKKAGLGKYIAEELASYGYECRYDVGVSGFKIDVAVLDPKNKHRFILAIMCDTPNKFSLKDRNVLQIQTLKRNNWNVLRLFAVNYYNNPKREIKKIKDLLDKLTGADKKGGAELNRSKKTYKAAALETRYENATYVTSGENDKEIINRLKTIVAAEEPISFEFLTRRCLASLGILKYGSKVESRMQALVALCGFKYERILGYEFYRKNDKAAAFDKYRVETGELLRKNECDFTPYEIIAIVRGALEDKVALYMDEIQTIVASVLRVSRPSDKFISYVNDCVSLGEDKGMFVRSVSDRVSLA
ncbi:MAG: DUF4011 domain-containing protein [Clostridiales bacterium]|nr:DUF4011 domain-containing protein [Clostridiales bacterium]